MPRRKNTAVSPAASPAPVADIATVAFVSLGCPKNLVDSEKMLGLLAEDGLVPVGSEDEADAIVVNTCGFLEASKLESIEELNRAAELKRQGKVRRLVVAGCLVQRHRAKMLEWCPDIDAMIGVFDRDHIVQAVRGPKAQRGKDVALELPVYSSIAGSAAVARRQRHVTQDGYWESDQARLRLTPRHYAYLRVSEGCNQNCAFCTIPSIRGKMRSKPVDAILAEAEELLSDGAFELNLIGQDTTSYGHDIGYGPGLAGMLGELDQLARQHGGAWLRLMYAYPSCFTDEMIDAIAGLPNLVKYIDMPLQHIDDAVLDRMRRRTSRRLIETLLDKLRRRVPGIAIRTTFISGFPGETDAQHQTLVQFVKDFGFEAMGVFPYSPEPGTPAGTMHERGEAVAEDVTAARVEELMLAQQEVVFARHAALAQQATPCSLMIEQQATVEGKATQGVGRGGRLYTARSQRQAPQIDGVTYVQSRQKLAPGEVVDVMIVDHDGYDLIARPADELTRNVRLPVL